ncbi:hypothetical protein ASF53_13920 [Methylobacterium sp. Leaf123]|uniref:hypothetical protein n=1 Tax=Methylobacterium sp. Leaf123 TaxID=1736264 RepID=UPI0006FB6DA1|nr:hypothetical protein [Methylobacterium sp. Leaf123]KQQ13268.1 hypothetical protein ASF53_13920 [Methylobacterium sp. Leaf123]
MRGLLLFAQDLGLDEETVREIYEAVAQEIAPTEANREERLAVVRRRLIAVAEGEEERPWCVIRRRERAVAETKKPRAAGAGGADVVRRRFERSRGQRRLPFHDLCNARQRGPRGLCALVRSRVEPPGIVRLNATVTGIDRIGGRPFVADDLKAGNGLGQGASAPIMGFLGVVPFDWCGMAHKLALAR